MRQPKNPFHPGEMLLEEFLKPAGMTQTDFANKLGWTRTRLNGWRVVAFAVRPPSRSTARLSPARRSTMRGSMPCSSCKAFYHPAFAPVNLCITPSTKTVSAIAAKPVT